MEIVSRAKAQSLGLKRYFTGLPCRNGHVCERYTNDEHCTMCGVERSRNFSRSDTPRRLMKDIRKRSARRNLECSITAEDLDLSGCCPICGCEFTSHIPGQSFYNMTTQPTVDRVDNSLGYTKANVAIICATCNRIKACLDAPAARSQAARLLKIAAFIDAHQKLATIPSEDPS